MPGSSSAGPSPAACAPNSPPRRSVWRFCAAHRGTLQLELLDSKPWKTRDELASAIFEWIVRWYNPKRRHSSIGDVRPCHI
ncbi:integrase core domain-containing protein [Amycolatopsis sp. NPDC059021]|uniref:integrase core domain-containing protein n=1 Tax=Amycolatopsis sp. NPDC059021 TaxID=3346704 RepID=UPI00366B5A41